jgi:hypothetical protein
VVFNDPDDDEYEEDEGESIYYLGKELNSAYWIFDTIAKGNADTFLKLYYETSRTDVFKTLAYSRTYHKLRNKRR